jgi:5-(carboxyamino)imidazole ribonucleotide synthase
MVEAFVAFERELAVQVARRPDGEQAVYPVAHTIQRNHRCHAVVVPAELDAAVSDEAQRVAQAAVDAVDGVGLTAVELFEMPDGTILVNELAPRPHNTGHYSIEGAYTSQFENHVRAILGWPLGSTDLRAPVAVMVNVLGRREGTPPQTRGLHDALAVPGATVHIYGKPDVRPNRKMGHVTVTGSNRDDVYQRAEEAAGYIRL